MKRVPRKVKEPSSDEAEPEPEPEAEPEPQSGSNGDDFDMFDFSGGPAASAASTSAGAAASPNKSPSTKPRASRPIPALAPPPGVDDVPSDESPGSADESVRRKKGKKKKKKEEKKKKKKRKRSRKSSASGDGDAADTPAAAPRQSSVELDDFFAVIDDAIAPAGAPDLMRASSGAAFLGSGGASDDHDHLVVDKPPGTLRQASTDAFFSGGASSDLEDGNPFGSISDDEAAHGDRGGDDDDLLDEFDKLASGN